LHSCSQLEELVRFKWQSKIKELGVVDTNSTTNWRRLTAEIRQQLLNKSSCDTVPQDEEQIESPCGNKDASKEVTPASLLQQIKYEVVARVMLKVLKEKNYIHFKLNLRSLLLLFFLFL
jgi:Fe-S cluster assembly scaffold protein SufB